MTVMTMRTTARTGPMTQSMSGSSACLLTPLESATSRGSEKGLAARVRC